MKYYIMTSLSRRAEHNYVRDQLNALGHEITCDWTAFLAGLDDPYESRMQDERIAEMAAQEMEGGVCSANFCVALLPGGRGTHTEFGAALALNKPLIVHAAEDLRAPGRKRCSFYFHPKIQVWLSGELDIVANYVRDYPWSKPSRCGWTLFQSAYTHLGPYFVEVHQDARGEWSCQSDDAPDRQFASVWFKPDGSIDEFEADDEGMDCLEFLSEQDLRDGLCDLGRILSKKGVL